MSPRTVIAHVIFAALAAGLALYVSQSEPPKTNTDNAGVVLLKIEENAVEEVHYTWADGELWVRPDKRKGRYIAELDHAPPKSKPEDPRERFTFPAGRGVLRALDAMAPLRASRSLGVVDDQLAETFGLKAPERHLEIVVKGERYRFDVGVEAANKRKRYLKRADKANIYLVKRDLVSGLEGNPSRLQETRVVLVDEKAVSKIALQRGADKLVFEHQARDNDKEREFVLLGREAPVEVVDEVVSALRGLRARRYLEASALEGATLDLRAQYAIDDEEDLVVELFRAGDERMVRAGRWIAQVSDARYKRVFTRLDKLTATSAPR